MNETLFFLFCKLLFPSRHRRVKSTTKKRKEEMSAVYHARLPSRCCITGPQWIGENYFQRFYAPEIDKALADPQLHFVLGDADGTDQLAQRYLAAHGAHDRTTVYVKHGKAPRLVDVRFKVNDSAASYPERDMLMAECASSIIAVLPQFGNLTTGASLPLYAHNSGANIDADQVAGSHVAVLLDNRAMEISPKIRLTAETVLAGALRDELLARHILQVLRTYSEPEDKELTRAVAFLYELWYAPPEQSTAVARSGLSGILLQRETGMVVPPVDYDGTM